MITKQDLNDTVKGGLLFEETKDNVTLQVDSGEPGLIEVFIQKRVFGKDDEIIAKDFTDIQKAYNFIVNNIY